MQRKDSIFKVMEKFLKRAWAEIHLDRLKNNADKLKGLIDTSKTAPMAVVKANAYGHGDIAAVKCLEENGFGYFAVSNITEAERLRDNGCNGEILILGYTPPEYADELSRHNIIQAAVSAEHAKELSENSENTVRIHIAVDTGMGRIGISAADTEKAAEQIKYILSLPHISAEGMFTHYACADSLSGDDKAYTEMQTKRFFGIADELAGQGIRLKHYHCLNSAGTAIHYNERSTLSRMGIMLYGLLPDYTLELPIEVEPVMELKAAVSYVKKLNKGDFVSYGRTFRAEKEITAATIPIGYADGLPRQLSGKASVIINGCKAPIIGRICMDQLMADVSEIPDVHEGTEVTLFGSGCGQTADDIALLCGTIGYEIVCGISGRVPRVIMENGKIISVDLLIR